MDFATINMPTKSVADLMGLNYDALQTWLRRNEYLGSGGPDGSDALQGGGGQGRYRMFNFRNIIEIAFTHYLVNAGFPLDTAVFVGGTFAYTGELPGNMGVDIGHDYEHEMREPGFPFYSPTKTIFTYAYFTKDGCAVVGTSDGFDHEREAMIRLGWPRVWSRVDCNEVFFNVCERLQIVPIKALHQVYQIAV